MTAELWISIGSLIATTIVGILTIIANIKINNIKNLEAIHKYKKRITYFELQTKDEKWLKKIFDNEEFGNYDLDSQKKIMRWWYLYQETNEVKTLKSHVDISQLSSPGRWSGSSGEEFLLFKEEADTEEVNQQMEKWLAEQDFSDFTPEEMEQFDEEWFRATGKHIDKNKK